MKIVLFNGPPRSGKDTAANMLDDYLWDNTDVNTVPYKFAKPLKVTTHSLYGLYDLPHDHFEDTKDIPNELFFGLTPREAYIKVAQEMVKPILGNDHWARLLIKHIKPFQELTVHSVVIISDCGFIEEIQPLKKVFGTENMLIVHMKRDGCDFKKDSRGYVTDPEISTMEISNNGTTEELFEQVKLLGNILTQ